MKTTDSTTLSLAPEVFARASGGYLAVSPEGGRLRIGVLGESQEEAVENYERALQRWAAILGYEAKAE